MFVSINGPGDPDIWPFDFETGMRDAPKVANLPSGFRHPRPLRSQLFAMYARDGQTDGQKQPLLAPSLRTPVRREGVRSCV